MTFVVEIHAFGLAVGCRCSSTLFDFGCQYVQLMMMEGSDHTAVIAVVRRHLHADTHHAGMRCNIYGMVVT